MGEKGGSKSEGPISPEILTARRLDKEARQTQEDLKELRKSPKHVEPGMTNPTNWKDATADNTGLGKGPRVPRR